MSPRIVASVAVALVLAACAHERPGAPPPVATPAAPAGPQPVYAAPVTPPADWLPVPAPVTAGAPAYPAEATGAAGYGETTTAPIVLRLERPSPPPLGADDLAMLPEAASPARNASLKLAQDGRLAWMNRDAVVARQKLQTSLQLWGANPYAKYYLGILELESGHYAQAESFARDAARRLRENPFYEARAYLLLALALERSGDAGGAFEARAKADQLDPRVELK